MGDSSPGNLDALSDDELVDRILVLLVEGKSGGAWELFEILYRREVQEVLNTVHRFLLSRYFLADHDLAQQLTQEAFVQAWNGLPQKNPQAPFLAWLKVIAINEARQYRRKHRREAPLEDNAPDSVAPTSWQQPSEASLEAAEMRAKIERVKQCLTQGQREVFTLYYEQGYPVQEIAATRGILPASVRQMLWRATQRFRQEWIKEADDTDSAPAILKPIRGGSAPGPSDQA